MGPVAEARVPGQLRAARGGGVAGRRLHRRGQARPDGGGRYRHGQRAGRARHRSCPTCHRGELRGLRQVQQEAYDDPEPVDQAQSITWHRTLPLAPAPCSRASPPPASPSGQGSTRAPSTASPRYQRRGPAGIPAARHRGGGDRATPPRCSRGRSHDAVPDGQRRRGADLRPGRLHHHLTGPPHLPLTCDRPRQVGRDRARASAASSSGTRSSREVLPRASRGIAGSVQGRAPEAAHADPSTSSWSFGLPARSWSRSGPQG